MFFLIFKVWTNQGRGRLFLRTALQKKTLTVPIENLIRNTKQMDVSIKTKYSVLLIYRGGIYCGIAYIAVACWIPFFLAPMNAKYYFANHSNSLDPIRGRQFFAKSAHHGSFCSWLQATIFQEISSSLPVNGGWNTCYAMVSDARWSIVLQSRVQLIQCQYKSRLQIANLSINVILIKSSLFDHTVYIHHLVQRQFRSKSRARDWYRYSSSGTVETLYSMIPYTTIFDITRWADGPQNLQTSIRTLIVLLGFQIKQIFV